MASSRPAIDFSEYLFEPEAPQDAAAIDWAVCFGNRNPVELEIGSGKGLFLANAASSNPRHNFLGIELSRKYAQLAAERAARRALPNARLWRGDAGLLIARLVPTASLRAVHVYFPDPWWKRRHKKRRVFTNGLLGEIARTLEPGGKLKVASDVEEYFGVIQSLIAANPRFSERTSLESIEPAAPHEYLTSFERKYRLTGRPIFRALYVLDETASQIGT